MNDVNKGFLFGFILGIPTGVVIFGALAFFSTLI